MAANHLLLHPNCIPTKFLPFERKFSLSKTQYRRCNIQVPVPRLLRCVAATNVSDHATVLRNEEKPTNIWVYDYIQSLSSEYAGESHVKQQDKLIGEVRSILDNLVNPLEKLEAIDVLQRLGISYHFKDEIKRMLDDAYNENVAGNDTLRKKHNLYATAIEFRLLRQHGYDVSTDAFNSFRDEVGNFKSGNTDNIRGMLSLYEASYLSVAVTHGLEIPLHWRLLRLEARWFIDMKIIAVLIEVITVIDDVYDAHGTLEQLELFTEAMDRWDVNLMDNLPDYMKIYFFALNEFENKIASDILNKKGINMIPFVKKAWTDYFKASLVEAQWYFSEHTPTLQEHLANTWISTSLGILLVHAFFSLANPITKEALDCLEQCPDVIRCAGTIMRLSDDLNTSLDELECPTSIKCYMNETGATEEEAREKIRSVIELSWKQMNKYRVTESPIPHEFTEAAMNLSRVCSSMYEHGDGFTHQETEIKGKILSLFSKPIPFVCKE
ncbi:Terpene_synth domain-containing protein [Quillaja saponaria]|uniref:Terpene_synth domain-containing protein n=1 Tax=Quillaja saponaria TaxID=32244 RepID=A0AAD7L4L4_QUISA|nr:Terpene_synth domain-containing protein [Quillaja saponaria]